MARVFAVLMVAGLMVVGVMDQALASGNPAADRIPDVGSIDVPAADAAADFAPAAAPPDAAADGLATAESAP